MKSPRSPLLVIPLALVPLALVWACSYWLYAEAGIGRHRPIYDLLRSDEDLYASTRGRSESAAVPADRSVRWTGSAGDPANVVILGTSITGRALARERSRPVADELGLEIYQLWNVVNPIDRYYDTLKIVASQRRVDVVIIENSFGFANDYVLGYREQTVFGTPWNPTFRIYDAEMLRLRRAFGLPDDSQGDPQSHRNAYNMLRTRLDRNEWMDVHDGPQTYEHRGHSEIDDPMLLTNYSMMYSLIRIGRLCREEGIGLVVYVPPGIEPLLRWAPGGQPLPVGDGDPAPHSRKALRLVSAAHAIKVLDYHDYFDDRRWFRDALHLNTEGALEFSDRFFGDLGEFLAAGGREVGYEIVVRAP